jgi:hypothetical protein
LGNFLKPGHTIFGCSWGAPARNGDQYKIAEKCAGMMTGYKNIVLTVQSDSAYTKTTDEGLGKMRDTTSTVGRRIGAYSG